MTSPELPLPPLEIQALLRSDDLCIARVAGIVEYETLVGINRKPQKRRNYSPVYITEGYRNPEEAIADAIEWMASNSDREYIILNYGQELVRNRDETWKKEGIGKTRKVPYTIPEVKTPRFPKGNTP